MHRNKIKSWHRRLAAELGHLQGMERSWRRPPEALRNRQDLMSFAAHFALISLDAYIEGYERLIFDKDAPTSLKIEAAANRRLARNLAIELEPAAEAFRERIEHEESEGPPETGR